MGEIFRREAAEQAEPFTGERLTSAIGGQVAIEHYHRYLLARSLAAGLDVLDVASGEGYGSALLAQVARSVVGIDQSEATVRGAANAFERGNLSFLQADARAMPLADACVDMVVSFETIEHFDCQDDFLREIHRVLRPGGRLLVSTPDRDIYSPTGSEPNRFHARELSRDEFAAILVATFQHLTMVQQRPLIGSALLADSVPEAAPLVFERRGVGHFEACTGIPRAPYLIALASDGELPPLPPSLYIERSDLDTETFQRVSLAAQLGDAEAELLKVRQQVEQARQHVDKATQCADQATQRAQRALRQAEEAEQRAEQDARKAAEATRLAQQQTERAEQAESARLAGEQRYEALRRDYHIVQGSMRTFLRFYLPRLRRHFLGQRP